MSYHDDKFGEIFPTRNGVPSGTANERKMLDVVDGSDSFKTRIETANGVETTLRTKNGMPQFTTREIGGVGAPLANTKPKQQRTFVFADRFSPTIGVVANLDAASHALVRVGDPIETREHVCYSVLGTRTAKAGMKPVSWKDVLRLDSYGTGIGYRVRVNGDHHVPNYIVNYGERRIPGFPIEVDGKLYVANDWYQVNVGSDYVDQMGVVEYNSATGSVVAFYPVVGDTIGFLIDLVSGIYIDDGAFHFYWYGANTTLYGGAQISCHTSIKPVAGGSPEIAQHQTVTVLPLFDATGMLFVPQAVSIDEKVIGNYYATQKRIFSGNHGPLNVYKWATWVGSDEPALPKSIYTAVSNTTWSSSIDWTDSITVGYGMAELAIDYAVFGDESWLTVGGGSGASPASRYYVISEGNRSTWSRITGATLAMRHVKLGVNLFSVDFSMTSNLDFGEFREAISCTYDYSNWDSSPSKINFGGYYSPDNPAASAASEAQVSMAVQQFNDTMLANASQNTPPDFSGTGYGVTHSTDFSSSSGSDIGARNDNHTLTVKSRDYIYLDLDEDVSLYLEGVYTETRGDTSSPPITITLDGGYDVFNSEFTVDYVFEFRGMTMRYPVYHHADTANSGATWSAQLNMAPVWKDEVSQPSGQNRFSLIHVPQNPEPVFTPLYTCQNRCPWMAYTTKAEEAAGATPELYIDAELSALAYGHTETAGWVAPMTTNVTFAAHQLTRILSNYIGYYAPDDPWNTLMFPTSTRIQYATGLNNPWPAAIGAGFSGSSRVSITRI